MTQNPDEFVLLQKEDYDETEGELVPDPFHTCEEILEWLKPTRYDEDGGEFKRHLASHVAGTNRWLTKTHEWEQWHETDDRGLLWVKGIPGSGKSVLVAHLARQLSRNDAHVLYFFFRQIVDANHTPHAALRDYLAQLLFHSTSLQAELSHYVDTERDLDSISMDDLWRALKRGLSDQKNVYVIADALDEMDHGNDAFIQILAELGHLKPSTIKVLLTSRPVPTIEHAMRNTGALQIRLDERLVDIDIATYVSHRLSTSSLSPSDRASIHEAIPGHANGLFLYAKLAMDKLLRPGADVRNALDTIPKNINTMFTTLLLDHADRSGISLEFQLMILRWVTHASRPLRLVELSEVVYVVFGKLYDHAFKDIKSLIRTSCGPLIEILPDETLSVVHHSLTEFLKGWTRDATFETSGDAFPIFEPGPTHLTCAHACFDYLSPELLNGAYGTTDVPWFWNKDGREQFQIDHPFANYATAHWHVHVSKAVLGGVANEEAQRLYERIEHLLSTARDADLLSHIMSRAIPIFGTLRELPNIHVSVSVGLTGYTRKILEEDPSALERKAKGNTPLCLAAAAGHLEIVQLLLSRGANPSPSAIVGDMPLEAAARAGHSEVVTALLAAGANPLAEILREDPGSEGFPQVRRTALLLACQSRHADVAMAFIPYLTPPGKAELLTLAASTGFTPVVGRLLDGEDVQVDALRYGHSALSFACRERHYDSIRLLLKAGADPNLHGDSHLGTGSKQQARGIYAGTPQQRFTPLHALTEGGENKLVRVYAERDRRRVADSAIFNALFAAGADVNMRDLRGNTPLHFACGLSRYRQYDDTSHREVELLLAAGADANIANDEGRTPIYKCIERKASRIMHSLIEKGRADINHKDPRGHTPLLAFLHYDIYRMSSEIDVDMIMDFLKYKPDCKLTDESGNSALHIFLDSRYNFSFEAADGTGLNSEERLLAALLASGADPSQRNKSGETPLHRLRIRDDVGERRSGVRPDKDFGREHKIIQMMVKAGADLNAQTWNGDTILSYNIHRKASDIQGLLDAGCDVHARDYEGGTLLHALVRRVVSHKKESFSEPRVQAVLELLISRGLGLGVTNYAGNTLFHELATAHASRGCLTFVEQLKAVLSPDQGNFVGRTPLHIVSGFVHPPLEGYEMGAENSRYDASFACILDICTDVNARDKDGNTPLHLSASINEYRFLRLLERGADIFAKTDDGHTALHLASRDRQSNIVGLICDHLQNSTPPMLEKLLNAQTDGSGYTALHYACQSGRPETVQVLLRSGADPNAFDRQSHTPLAACVKFEEEQQRLLEPRRHWIEEHEYARLEEITQIMMAHGADISSPPPGSTVNSITWILHEAAIRKHHYTYACFDKLRKSLPEVTISETRTFSRLTWSHAWASHLSTAAQQAYDTCEKPSAQGSSYSYSDFALSLILDRQFDLVRQFVRTTNDFSVRECQTIFARHGYVDLLEEAFQRVPLAFVDQSGEPHAHEALQPILVLASSRALPNTEVLECIVRQEGGRADARCIYHSRIEKGRKRYGDTALHVLARGQYWWQAFEGISCLLDAGADINARGQHGQTPLHTALNYMPTSSAYYRLRSPGCHGKKAVQLLISRGANLDIATPFGQPCLTMTDDMDIIAAMLQAGAERTAPTLYKALADNNSTLLETFLLAGVNPNQSTLYDDMRWLFGDFSKDSGLQCDVADDYGRRRKIDLLSGSRDYFYNVGLNPHDELDGICRTGNVCPLLYAASRRIFHVQSNVALPSIPDESRLVRTLLRHGADPLYTLSRPAPSAEQNSPGLLGTNDKDPVQQTVVHAIIYEGGLIEPFLELPGLNLEVRDQRGMTLLLAACCGRIRQDRIFPRRSATDYATDDDLPKPIPVAEQLIAHGADVYARDALGNNALHLLSAFRFRNLTHDRVISLLLQRHPDLVHQSNLRGDTPYHVALRIGCMEVIARMLDGGANVHRLDSGGDNALHQSARMGSIIDLSRPDDVSTLVRRVLDLGVDINSRNSQGETMLLTAMNYSNLNAYLEPSNIQGEARNRIIFDDLIAAGADIHARDSKGNTLLHKAAHRSKDKDFFQSKSAKFYAYLMSLGLDPLAENYQHRTSIDIAVGSFHRAILKLFEKSPGEDAAKKSSDPSV